MMKKISNFHFDFKKNAGNLLFWLGVYTYLELVFGFFTFDTYLRSSIINIAIYIVIMASITNIVTDIFKEKINHIIYIVNLSILGLLFSLQFVFYRIFKSFFSFEVIGLGNQLQSFLGETLKCIFNNLVFIILFFMPLIIYLIGRKKWKKGQNGFKRYVFSMLVFIIGISLLLIDINAQKKNNLSIYDLYNNTNQVALNVEKLGVMSAYHLDIYRTIFGFDTKIVEVSDNNENDDNSILNYNYNILDLDFSKSTTNSEIKAINSYMKSSSGTKQNKYTGLFKDYNLVYITAESFSQIGVSKELTPTLYKLINTGFKFNNYYTPNTLSTIGGEFQSLTGLYPSNSILTTWRRGKNYFPYGLATVFKNLNYNTYAYHDNWYGFQDRHKYLASQGFSNYLGCYNGLEKRINCKAWPQSDNDMITTTVGDYINNDQPFMTYYMTVSGHFDYNFSANSMAYKHRNAVSNLNVSTAAKAYVATQIELDQALETLLKELEKAGKLDNTVIVLLADHYPYDLSIDDINSLSTYKRDNIVEVNHNSLIIWNNKLKDIEVDKVCMSSDVLPTVYNLFGVDYDSRLFTGNDILSSKEGLAIFSNNSWVSDSGTYYASSGKFINTKEVNENYVNDINKIVSNRLNISRLIIKNNYYNYLFK